MDKNVRVLSITQEKFRQGENVVSVGLFFMFILCEKVKTCLSYVKKLRFK